MSNLTSDELHHAGRKGMKWGMNIFGRRRTGSGGRFRRDKNADPKNVKIPKKLRKSVDERMREAEFLDMYRSRDNMSTKALKSKIARLEAERKFKELVEAPEKARREALQKKKQARLAFVGKAASAALDVYSKVPSSVVGNGKSGQAAKDAIEAFKKKQEWAKAFKDVPTTMTKFTQSISIGGVDVYIPETIQNRFMIQHAGRKGMKWGMHIFGDPNRRAFKSNQRLLRKEARSLVSKNFKLQKRHAKGVISDKEYNKQSQSIQFRQKQNAMERGKNPVSYTTSGRPSSKKQLGSRVANSIAGGVAGYLITGGNPLGGTAGAISGAMTNTRSIVNNQRANSLINDTNISSRVDRIDKYGARSAADALKTHENVRYTIYDNGPTKLKKRAKVSLNLNHSGVNMGEIIDGVYLPSQDDLLLHYGKKGMKWKKKGEGAIGVGTVGAAPAFQDKALERRAIIERLIAKEHEKAANKTKDSKKKEIRKKLRDKADKNSKELEKKRENMYNPYRGDKLPKKKVKHSDASEDTLLHYGKKGMKWKKHLKNAANAVIDGVENAANWVDDQTFDKNRESALKDRSDSNKRKINDPEYGKTYNTASDPVDGKKNVDVKRALRAGRDNVVPSRTREGMKQENKYIEKIRKRVKLPRVK